MCDHLRCCHYVSHPRIRAPLPLTACPEAFTSPDPWTSTQLQITSDGGQSVEADQVITQSGGIASGSGASGPRATFATGVQFTITDPAYGKVRSRGPRGQRAGNGRRVGQLHTGRCAKALMDWRAECARKAGRPCPHLPRLPPLLPQLPLQVQAFDGPSDPMLVTSSTPGASDGSPASPGAPASNSTSPAPPAALRGGGSSPSPPPSPGASSSCQDLPTPDGYTCAQQKGWGKCGEPWIAQNGYCKATCGACGSSSVPQVQAASGPPSSGRKMLLRRQR